MKKLYLTFTFACAVAMTALAAEPKCEVTEEFWGKRYAILTTVSGKQHKITLPAGSALLRVKVKTGYYVINSDGVIVEYRDPILKKGGK